MKRVYLDHHATTPLDPRVLEAMLPYLKERYGNPSSKTHPFGWEAQEAVEAARARVAALIGASPKEIIFTAGATESNNLALLGAARAASGNKNHLITQATEHHAVLDTLHELKRQGFELTTLRPDREGFVDAEQVAAAITERTVLVTIMAAQNEIGTLQPIAAIGRVCREHGVLFHTDAAQAAGKIPLDVEAAAVDLLSLSGHKFYGPKGVGALYVRRRGTRVRLAPILFGGGQEGGLRPGTSNVPGIVGLGEACRVASEEMGEESTRLGALRERLWRALREGVPGVRLNGPVDGARRLAGNLSVSFPGVDGAALVVGLKDIAASTGSACTAGSTEPSYVLKAIGVPTDLATSTLRLGLGRHNDEADVDHAAARIVETVRGLGVRAGLRA